MKYKSVFDIIGPIMIGPSSSHTAGAARIGRVARSLFGREPQWAVISFYGSFAETFKGHATDVAIVGGLLDFDTFDERIKEALEIARKRGIDVQFVKEKSIPVHPNTAKIRMGDEESEMELVGISIGGGKIEITELNGFELKLTGHHPAILVVHDDRAGAIATVSNELAKHSINIGHMQVSRKGIGEMALMTIEVDQIIGEDVLEKIRCLPHITQVVRVAD